jgi:hypothetical protein|tara:strand:+ start:517 stop:756 length:240 start_codon:yes stop_codon:yes gene_type:complete
MADLYFAKLNLEALEALKDNAYKGKYLDVAVWINNDVDHTDDNENWKAISISHGNKKKGETVVYVANGKKYVQQETMPF